MTEAIVLVRELQLQPSAKAKRLQLTNNDGVNGFTAAETAPQSTWNGYGPRRYR